MSIIEQITGSELERAIARASTPYVAWFDGTAETGGTSFVGFVDVMDRFAVHLRSLARVVLINVEVWDGTAARYGVIGSPELVLFKDGRKIAHHIGTAPLAGLLLWARPLFGRLDDCGRVVGLWLAECRSAFGIAIGGSAVCLQLSP